jgi:two-component system cell cycle response regulator
MGVLVCVDPRPEGQALAAEVAAQGGLSVVSFMDADAALDYVQSDQEVSVLVVAAELNDCDGTRLIQAVRLLPQRLSVPIAYVVDDAASIHAGDAMQSGATEVMRRSDRSALRDLVERHQEVAANEAAIHGRVLLVEDSPIMRSLIADLANALGLAVDACGSYAEAEAKIGNAYDLIIVDVVLDEIRSGLTLVREIRRGPDGRRHTPVLVMSGYEDSARRLDALRSGADDYLSKPFEPEEFVWRVRRLLEMAALRQAANLRSEDGGVRTEQAQARLELTAREMEVYSVLRTGAGDKQIAAQLGISFWTVRTHIQSIFNKLGVMNRRELMVADGQRVNADSPR